MVPGGATDTVPDDPPVEAAGEEGAVVQPQQIMASTISIAHTRTVFIA
jgi:hypothetical protein